MASLLYINIAQPQLKVSVSWRPVIHAGLSAGKTARFHNLAALIYFGLFLQKLAAEPGLRPACGAKGMEIKMVWLHCFVHSWNINDMEIESLLPCCFIIIRTWLYIYTFIPADIQVGAVVLEPNQDLQLCMFELNTHADVQQCSYNIH